MLPTLLAFDLETTGVDPLTARVVTYALAEILPDGTVGEVLEGIIDPGIEIPEGAAAVHGVTTERAQAEGVRPLEGLPVILERLTRHDTPVVIFNARYDLTVLFHELQRHLLPGGNWLEDLVVIDPLVIDKALDRFRKGKRQLGVTCEHYGVTLENAHTADADAIAAGLLTHALAKKWPWQFVDLDRLHKSQVVWAEDQAKSLQEFFRRMNPEAYVEPRWPLYKAVELQ